MLLPEKEEAIIPVAKDLSNTVDDIISLPITLLNR